MKNIENKLKNGPFYLEKNLKRYKVYWKKYPDKDLVDIIKEVNVNIDYEFYTNIKSSDLTHKNLMLVNKYYKLSECYEPNDLILIPDSPSLAKLTKEANDAFVKMVKDALNDNIKIIGLSGYRTYQRQEELYNGYVLENGEKWADMASARPGHSEHQTGLAIDVNLIDSAFATTEEFRWLEKNAYKYGFILRYPKGKEYLTGYKFEPWHYRYVGQDVSKFIYENNLTFEEYYAYFLEK